MAFYRCGGGISTEELYEALQYSGLVTEDMTADEMLAALAAAYPAVVALDLSTLACSKFANPGATTTVSQSKNSIVFSGSGVNVQSAVSHSFSISIPNLLSYKKVKVSFAVSGNIQTADIYLPNINIAGMESARYNNGTYIKEVGISAGANDQITVSFYTASADYTTSVTITEITLYA